MGRKPTAKASPGTGVTGQKTVGVYNRPPQKKNLKPILLALIIALAVIFIMVFYRFSQGSSAGDAWGERAVRVAVEEVPQAELIFSSLEGRGRNEGA